MTIAIFLAFCFAFTAGAFATAVRKSSERPVPLGQPDLEAGFLFGIFYGLSALAGGVLGSLFHYLMPDAGAWIVAAIMLMVAWDMLNRTPLGISIDVDLRTKLDFAKLAAVPVVVGLDAVIFGLILPWTFVGVFAGAALFGFMTFVSVLLGCGLGRQLKRPLYSSVERYAGIAIILCMIAVMMR